VDVKRAADFYAQGWTLRQIGAEFGVHWSTVGQQLQRAGFTLRRSGPWQLASGRRSLIISGERPPGPS